MLCFITGCSEFDINPRMFSSYVDYDLSIRVSEKISNATFYLPLPVKNNTPMINSILLDERQFQKDNISIEFVQYPPGIDMSDLNPLNNQSWFLKITAETIVPDHSGEPEYDIEIENIISPESPLLFSNTFSPIVNESVFLPKLNFSPTEPMKSAPKSQYWFEYTPIKVQQKIPVYADYSASRSTRVEIYSSIHSSNSWKEKYDESGSNSYDDVYSWHQVGEVHGWQTAEGTYEVAKGIYPNLDHPVWLKVINTTKK